MRALKFVILGVAVAAGAGAVYLVQDELDRARVSASMVRPEAEPDKAPEPPVVPKVFVLVATGQFERGHILRPQDFEWREWPEETIAEAFILQRRAPEAIAELSGAVVRSSITRGEPIVAQKVINLDHPGALAALLRPGMRGFAIRMGPETGAGGLILPGNYVDVILTRREKVEVVGPNGRPRSRNILFTNTLIRTARVVAVDTILDDEGRSAIEMRRTITLELTPDQVELLSLAEEAGRLTVAVRSIGDLVDENGERIADPFPTLAVDLEAFAGASLGMAAVEDSALTAESDRPELEDPAGPAAHEAQSEQKSEDAAENAPRPAPTEPKPVEPAAPAAAEAQETPATVEIVILRANSVSRTELPAPNATEPR